MDDPENPTTYDAQDTRARQIKQKHSIICVGHHHTQGNTNKT